MAFNPSLFESQRRGIELGFTQNSALNTYRRYLAETQGQRQLAEQQDLAFGYQKQVPRLTASFGKRGLQGQGIRSGAFSDALTNYARQSAKGINYAQQDLASQLRGFDLGQTQGFDTYKENLKNLEESKQRQIASDAAALMGLR